MNVQQIEGGGVLKSSLNLDPFPNTALCGRGYLLIHVLLNNRLVPSDELPVYSSLLPVTPSISYVGNSVISNQPIAGSIIVMQVRLPLFLMIVLPVLYCLIDLVYGPIRFKCTVSHGFSSAIFLGSRCL